MKMKKLLVLVIAIVMLATIFAGCKKDATETTDTSDTTVKTETKDTTKEETKTTEEAAPDRKIKVTYALNSFETLDPVLATGNPIITIGYSLFEPLWSVNEAGEEVGVVAKDWTIEDTVVNVNIYDYVYDSAGNHITAADVVFAYDQWKNVGNARNGKYFESVTATGDYSLEIVMTIKPYKTLLSGSRAYVMSEAAYTAADADFVNNPITTGHYTVKEFVSGSSVVMTKRDSHWQSDVDESLVPYLYKANADEVEIDVIMESQQVQTGLETGDIQAGSINVTIAKDLEESGRANVSKVPGNYAHTIMFNCYDGPFVDNLALRQAVAYAIDTASIADAVTKGTGHMSYAIGNEFLDGYQEKWESEDYYNYDVDKAKELMAEAGYPDGGITLRWLGKTDEFVTLTAQIVQANLADIGITVEIQSLDNTSYMANRPAGSKAWDLVWGDSVPKGSFVLSMMSYVDEKYDYDGTAGNMEGYSDPALQDMLMKTLYDQTPENIDEFHQAVKEACFAYGSYVDYNFYGVDPRVTMVYANDGEPAPNAFIFADDYDVYAD